MGGRGYSSAMSRRAESPRASYTFRDFFSEFGDEWGGEEFVPDEVFESLKAQGLNGGEPFQTYLDKNNDYAKPQVLEPDEFDKYVSENNLEVMYRGNKNRPHYEGYSVGMTGAEMNDVTLYGDKYYVGYGAYGSGLYFGAKASTAVNYATDGGTGGFVMKGALKPSARVVEYEEISRLYKIETGFTPDGSSSLLSGFARSKGYDAIYVERRGFTNVINRGAMVFSSKYTEYNVDGTRV